MNIADLLPGSVIRVTKNFETGYFYEPACDAGELFIRDDCDTYSDKVWNAVSYHCVDCMLSLTHAEVMRGEPEVITLAVPQDPPVPLTGGTIIISERAIES